MWRRGGDTREGKRLCDIGEDDRYISVISGL
ncbi:hypothetical protein T11_15757 [Trichinella zimbabwensis]|uniref:Uncharacterized protein n=1 Tax=Trichinella zimbabwensis TaxID=268475 RepID=A0A0V1GGF0_9BILA|nr:hypothetical protein T11_15757 [Trichinella zimbabwensis]